jgi:serine/threonine-protein kinase
MARLATDTLVANRYRLLHRLGAGGMADVWAADDQMLDRRVALKFLLPRYAEDQQFVERFRREAAAAAGLQHPNVVGVYDRGEHEGVPFIAMEYVQGASLKDLIDRGLSTGEAVEINRQVLAGVRFAHSKGIIHRDLKPQNILVDGEGRARVADFGIARAGASEITQTGSVLGTAQYLSPEQAQGLPVTAASDLYSVGAMLYETLTGQVPFDADTPVAVALKQVSEQPRPPSQLNPKVPPALDAVVLRALAKEPGNRYASADEFLRALDSAEADPSGRGLGDTAAYTAAGAAAGVAAGAAAGAALASADTKPPPGEGDETPSDAEQGFWTRNRKIAAGVIAALLVVGALVWFFFLRDTTSTTPVPKVTDVLLQQATKKLKHKGFDVDPVPAPNAEPPGTVLEQDPRAGTVVDEGSTVTLTYSSGPGAGTVPRVVGLDVDAATKLLRSRGFKVQVQRRFSDAAVGQVLEQDPAPGAHNSRGTTVTLTASKGPNLATVPSVVGQQQAAAETAIRAVGLKPHSIQQNADEPAGQVTAEDPSAGSSLDVGSVVTITVSNGSGSVVVPNVVGQLEDAARSTLQSKGVGKVIVQSQSTTDQSQDGRVVDQSPPGGTRQTSSDSVTIFVGRFKEPTTVTVPSVIGDDKATAEAAIRNAGLKVRSIGPSTGTVTDESPAAGTSVPRDTTVSITLTDATGGTGG